MSIHTKTHPLTLIFIPRQVVVLALIEPAISALFCVREAARFEQDRLVNVWARIAHNIYDVLAPLVGQIITALWLYKTLMAEFLERLIINWPTPPP